MKQFDLDSDGAEDVVAVSRDGRVVWWRNAYPVNEFESPRTIAELSSIDVSGFDLNVVDVDGDRDLDILVPALNSFDGAAWYENVGGTTFEKRLIDPNAGTSSRLRAGDFDGDGDKDIAASVRIRGEHGSYCCEMHWYENLGAQQFAQPRVMFFGSLGAGDLLVNDVDRDGDDDLLLAGGAGLYMLESRTIGDVNQDGSFDSADLVSVFAAGQFEDSLVGNSIFDTGDWNGDGEFDSADLVSALAAGHYQA